MLNKCFGTQKHSNRCITVYYMYMVYTNLKYCSVHRLPWIKHRVILNHCAYGVFSPHLSATMYSTIYMYICQNARITRPENIMETGLCYWLALNHINRPIHRGFKFNVTTVNTLRQTLQSTQSLWEAHHSI